MKRLLLFLFILPVFVYGQNFTLSGFVEDAQTGERLIGASVFDTKNNKYGTFSNEYGYFSLTMPRGKHHIRVSYVGYKPLDTVIDLNRDINLTFKLVSSAQIEAVVVTAYRNEVKSSQTGVIDVPVSKVMSLPVIFGEPDLMKTIQLMPGVQSGTEGSNGVFVRGGGPDQNLILLDGVPLYNVSHLMGFFSVFTPEAIKDVTLYKSGFPAHYGGRLSSVIDIRMKDGNMKKYTGSYSIGLISSKFTLEGPTVKDKGSFILSARRTYIDIISKPVLDKLSTRETRREDQTGTKNIFLPGYYFYDVYFKINHKITDKDRVYFSLYSGLDKAYFNIESTQSVDTVDNPYTLANTTNANLSWGNTILALRWNHAFSRKLFSNLTLTYSKFFFGTGMENNKTFQSDNGYSYDYASSLNYILGINDLAANLDFSYMPNSAHYLRFGLQSIYHTFEPGSFDVYINNVENGNTLYTYDTVFNSELLYAPELAFYIEDDIKLSSRLKANIGTRFTYFSVRNKDYYSFEPRVSARFLVNDDFSLKASYARMTQYLHFLTNNTVGLPLDLWMPATDRIEPEHSWQASGGFSWLWQNKFTITGEVFYKNMDNLVEIKEGESVFTLSMDTDNQTWEDKVTQGKGWSYGAELMIRKDYGRLSGWLSYTLSWSWRQFDSINGGEPFPYKYDRRHDFSIALNYKLNKNITFGAVWVYGSGTPVTLASYQILDPLTLGAGNELPGTNDIYYTGIEVYTGRNNYRLPAYHRLDLSANFKKEKKRGTRTWSVGLYNAYNHINPFYTELYDRGMDTYLATQTYEPDYVLRVYSLFPVMPFISYRFEFKH